MLNRGRRATTTLTILGVVLAGCGDSGQTTSSESSTTTAPVSTTAAVTTTTRPAATAPPTTLADPTIFNPNDIGNVLELSSFVLTIDVIQTSNESVTKNTDTLSYFEGSSASWLRDFDSDGSIDAHDYSIDGRYYDVYSDWYLYESGSPETPYILYPLPEPGVVAGQSVLTANFVGEEEFGGLAAYHFTFDETNLAYYDASVPADPGSTLEGDFYVAQTGSYVLYTHSKSTNVGEGGYTSAYEVTETLSAINELTEITLPADFQPMAAALDVGVELGALLPPGSSLSTLIRYLDSNGGIGGIGVDYYRFTTPVRDNTELLDYFRTLPPTNGWTVSHIGYVDLHLQPINCQTAQECVILKNGGTQVVVSFDGTILVEVDHDHVFSPL